MKKSKVLTQLALVIGIVVIVNLLSTKAFFRLDYTADQRYTLSKATEDIKKINHFFRSFILSATRSIKWKEK